MRYQYPHYAFLYEFAIGLICLFAVLVIGKAGIAFLACIGFRPFLLKTSPTPPDESVWRMYYDGFRWSVLLTGTTILVSYFLFEYLPIDSHDRGIVFLTTIPWFVVIHGLVGLILTWPRRRELKR